MATLRDVLEAELMRAELLQRKSDESYSWNQMADGARYGVQALAAFERAAAIAAELQTKESRS